MMRIRSTFKRKPLDVSLVATLGLLVFAAYALAENLAGGGNAGNFRIEGSLALSVSRTFTGEQEGAGKLLVPGRNLTILCQKGDVQEGKILKENEALAKVLFLECTAHNLADTEALPCTTHSTGQETGKILVTATVLPKLHESEQFLLFEPDGPAGTLFTTIELLGAECPLPIKNNISSSVVALVDNANEAVQHLITFSEAIQKLFEVGEAGDHLKFGTFESYIDASAIVALIGSHEGKVWSVE
jgi:hypothetical protein